MPLDIGNQTPYAVAKLEEYARSVRFAVSELPLIRKKLGKYLEDKFKAREIYGELQQQYNKLLTVLSSIVLSLLEMELPDIADYSIKLSQSIKSFNLMTPDYTKLCGVLTGYLAKLPVTPVTPVPDTIDSPDSPRGRTTNAAVIGRLMASVKMGYYPTDIEHVMHLKRGIGFPEDVTVNLFDPCCGCGLALSTLAGGHDCRTYGVELDGHRAEESLTRLGRVGFGSYFSSRISNEAFHLMLLNPPYLSVITEGGNNTRSEKRFLVDSISHLMYGGLLIYIIPYYRLTADVCRVLCDNFEDLTVWKFTGTEFKKFRQAAVMGVRRKRRDGSDKVSELVSLALAPDNLHELSELPENRYQLPATAKKIELFKGAEFNVAELAEQLNKSTTLSRMFEKSKLDSDAKRPLLPLNLGQVGLIGGSGLINGLVECDTPHIIKGRIVKENNVSREENLNNQGDLISTTVYETRSNKMVFNLLTPQGFISLADNTGSDTNGESSVSDTSVPFGRTVVTANADGILTRADINSALARHKSGDWGEVGKDDWKANDNALSNGERILSAYTSSGNEKFWIITEADRSYTTVLMPDDY